MLKTILLISILIFFTGSSILAFFEFNKDSELYKNITEVKGNSTETAAANSLNSFFLPFPLDHEIINYDVKNEGVNVTLKSNQFQGSIIEFYKNVMDSKKWTLETEGYINNFYNMNYTNNAKTVNFNIFYSNEEKSTIVNIITNFN